MGANNSVEKHLDQDYNEIKKNWINKQRKFEDDKFPLSNEILASSNGCRRVIWLRPDEICSRNGWEPPKMIVGGTNRFDINQGAIGNCWFQGKLLLHKYFSILHQNY